MTIRKIVILGANGFIGSALVAALLQQDDYEISALDISDHRIKKWLAHPRLTFQQGDMLTHHDWIAAQIAECDTVLPLVAIATPATYVSDPLKVFQLDFEANLTVVKQVVEQKKRLIFPSTSEVYGMCTDSAFDEENSSLVLGPIAKERWIYSCSKQMLDRVIYAYGQHQGLDFTLFRPFNWIGPQQDDPLAKQPRAIPQFIGNLLRGEAIKLVNGGHQRRTFLDISDGIDGLVRIIANRNNCASARIFNLGNPNNDYSIAEVADKLLTYAKQHYGKHHPQLDAVKIINISSEAHYGKGYQDVSARVPAIERAKAHLGWQPHVTMDDAISAIVDYHFK
ncbi:MAG: bifunctional UDP-4-keto-pentose/UDP-xylose synthase [Gammaproteobacteria bacterium]|nr:bifunctional UDP-4-keto-pentose/UDP-xylose synthase [Gammaproteobacteria bacterium]